MQDAVAGRETVVVVQHVRVRPDGSEDVKLIGVYRTAEAAHAAVERLRIQPGFGDSPRVLSPSVDDAGSGFSVDEYPLDQDHWTTGFFTT